MTCVFVQSSYVISSIFKGLVLDGSEYFVKLQGRDTANQFQKWILLHKSADQINIQNAAKVIHIC